MTNKSNLIRILVALGVFAVIFSLYLAMENAMPWWAWLIVFAADYLVIGYDVLWRACRNIVRGKFFDENFLMSVATVGAFAVREFSEAVAVMLFYQVGELFQSYAVGKSRKSIAALMDICPQTACVITADGEKVVDPDEVEVGSLLLVRAGEKIPIDGVIEEGEGYTDCSALTGESVPVHVSAGDSVLSGAIATGGILKVRTTKQYADSTVSKILELVENSAAKKAKSENFITRFAAVYTPVVVVAAVLLAVIPPLFLGISSGAVWSEWVTRALTFLVVSCPCALVISVPMSFFGGIGGASKKGILVKGGNFLELLCKADAVAFDKTGTITKGKFEVCDIKAVDGVSADTVLMYAGIAEKCSSHPVARSIVEAAGECPNASSAVEIAGRGVKAEYDGKSIVCGSTELFKEQNIAVPEGFGASGTCVNVAYDGRFLGTVTISDIIKEDSYAAIKALRARGIKTVMLTGDNYSAAKGIAEQSGVDEFYAGLLPDEKVKKIEEIMADGHTVAFVGDGINDAPVLSRADVGIAMGALGSDAAIEAADVVLMNDRLSQIVHAADIAKKTVGIVRQNIVFALAVKAAVLVLAAFGIANMWLAVFADVGVAVLAILNAMRALYPPRAKKKSGDLQAA